MSIVFLDGGDNYGPVNPVPANVAPLLTGPGAWTSASGVTIAAGLSSPGYALQIAGTLSKTLGTNYAHLIGGFRFKSGLASQAALIRFGDGGADQSCVTLETTGVIKLRSASVAGTVRNSGAVISANTIHYLEFDITFGAAAAYEIFLDGASLFSGTADTAAGTANDYANQLIFSGAWTLDDLYLFNDTTSSVTGAANDAVLNTMPVVETTFATGDNAVQFTPASAVLGLAYSVTTATNAPGANQLFLRRFVPGVACTINSVSCLPAATTAGKLRAVIFTETSGHAGTLLSSGTEVGGTTLGTLLTGALTSPQVLVAATPYWIGFIGDTSVALTLTDVSTLAGSKAANTYSGGAPSTAPAMTASQNSWMIYGTLTGLAVNWFSVGNNPPLGDISAVASSTLNQQDLYTFPALTRTPDKIYVVAIKEHVRNSDSGVRTIDLRMKSNATTVSGNNTGQTPATSYSWLDSYFEEDPNTAGTAWSPSGLNAAKSGQKIVS